MGRRILLDMSKTNRLPYSAVLIARTMTNPYALPSGEVVNLPTHCVAIRERFTLRSGEVVLAERVGPSRRAKLAS